MKVIIKPWFGEWILCITRDRQVIRSFTAKRLIEVIDVANLLQLHISNIDELPLNQYKQGV